VSITANVCILSDVCMLPANTGPCGEVQMRFNFDEQLGQCVPFTYGGCQGNANNFETDDLCRMACAVHINVALKPGIGLIVVLLCYVFF